MVGGQIGGRDQRAVGQRYADEWRSSTRQELPLQAGRGIPVVECAHGLPEVANEPATNWSGLIVLASRPTSSTMPQYSCPIGVGCVIGLAPR